MSTLVGGRDGAADRVGDPRAGYRLDRAVADIYGDLRLDPVLDHLLAQTTRITLSPFGAVSIVDASAGRYTKAAEHGVACRVGSSFPLDEGATGRAFAMRRPIVVADYAELPGGHLPKSGPSMHRAAVAVPVWWRDDVIAVNVAFLEPGASCTTDVIDDIEALSQTASSAILSSSRRDPTLAGALLRRVRQRSEVVAVVETRSPAHRADRGDAPPARSDSPLTPRERDVLALVRRGGSDREIAAQLGVSPKTVEKHVGALLRKTGSQNRTAAVSAATAFGWSDPD